MNELNTIMIGEKYLRIKTPTLKVLNDFKSEAGFDIATNPEALNTALGDFKKIAKICSVICSDISPNKLQGEQLSNYIYENATVNDFRSIMSFFSEELRKNSTGTVPGQMKTEEMNAVQTQENPGEKPN